MLINVCGKTEDPIAAIRRAEIRSELKWWVNQEATCICNDPGYYDREKQKWAAAIMLEDGQYVWLDGQLLVVKYMGNYSDMVHFVAVR